MEKLKSELLDLNSAAVLQQNLDEAEITELITFLKTKKVEVFVLDETELIDSGDKLMKAFSDHANFPESFGGNWNAVDEYLNYYEHLPANGYIFIFKQPLELKEKSPDNYKILLELIDDASNNWKKQLIPFKLLLGK